MHGGNNSKENINYCSSFFNFHLPTCIVHILCRYITVLFKNLNSIKFKLNKKNYFLKGEKNLLHILIFGGPSNKQLFFLFSLHYFTIFRYGTSVFKSRAHRPLLVCVYCHCLKSLKETGPYFI